MIKTSSLVYFSQQKPMFFEAETDILSLPTSANSFQLTVGKLFSSLLE